MQKIYPAHIRMDGELQIVQSVEAHCRQTAVYAVDFLRCVGLTNAGALIGWLHDCGKYSDDFADYIQRAADDLPVRRGSVNHSSAGLRYLLERYHHGTGDGSDVTAELLAYVIGAHHGLFDCVDEQRQNGFVRRQQQAEDSPTVMERFFTYCLSPEETEKLFQAAAEELMPLLQRLFELPTPTAADDVANDEFSFYVGLLTRLLLSALIDADRRDTAEFMLNTTYPVWPEDMRPIWQACLSRMEQKLSCLPTEKPIQAARRAISDQCAEEAARSGGVYRLNVPTGGGKTLSSLRYALTHAAKWNKHRIIFTAPLLSILDQNARVIRDYIGDGSLILEHHSNIIHTDDTEELGFLTETWQSPVIITTLVQLLNTLFSGKSSCIRRFHSLISSIVVIDEVQNVPANMLTLFNLAVNFLSEVCGTTVILCSATQPNLQAADHPLRRVPEELVPRQEALWAPFRRTVLQIAGDFRQEELPALVRDTLSDADSVLVICNTKKEAACLFKSLALSDIHCFHLSAAMCTQHRRDTLDAINQALKTASRRKVVCVSTQVIEAGVDISFARVIRLTAGMDSIVQAAGRCNRNGESNTPAPVQIVNCVDEDLTKLREIRRGKDATIALLNEFQKNPARFGSDLASDRAIERYYQCLYAQMEEHEQDYPAGDLTLFDLLARNEKFCKSCGYFLRQAFKTAGSLFTVFDEDTTTVIVPYEEGRVILEALIAESRRPAKDYATIQSLLTQAKPYTVSLYQNEINSLECQGALIPLFEGSVLAMTDGFYDPNTGFSKDFREVSI